MSKEKKIIFTEEIDSTINGYAVGISFIGIGLFLLLNPSYFSAPVISYICGAIIGAIGVCGTGIELSRSSKIKGMDNLVLGLVLIAVWLVSYLLIKSLWANIVFFLLMVLGCYAVTLGLLQGVYSIAQNARASENNALGKDKGALVGQSILFLTQLCSLTVAVLNTIKTIKALGI